LSMVERITNHEETETIGSVLNFGLSESNEHTNNIFNLFL